MSSQEFSYQDIPGLEAGALRGQTSLDSSSVFISAILEKRYRTGSLRVRRALGLSSIQLNPNLDNDKVFATIGQSLYSFLVWEGVADPEREFPLEQRRGLTSEADFGPVEEVTLSDGSRLFLNASPVIDSNVMVDVNPSSFAESELTRDHIDRVARDLEEATRTITGIGRYLGLNAEDAALSAQRVLLQP